MVKMIILLQRSEHPIAFDHYNDFRIALEQIPGIRKQTVGSVYAGPNGIALIDTVIEAFFDSREALHAGLTSPAGVKAGNLLIEMAGPDVTILYASAMEEVYPSDSERAGSS